MKIAFIVPYPIGKAPSQRFRFEQYFAILKENNFEFKMFSFYNAKTWQIIYSKGNFLLKTYGVIGSIITRIGMLFKLNDFDFVFIHRESCPIGPPFFEWFIAKVLNKKIIYDFDDAIWLTDEKARLSNIIRCFWKVKYICKWAYKVSCGNQYLANYASQWNYNTIINPTTIDTSYHTPKKPNLNNLPVIGWTGSHSTLKYLTPIIPILKEFQDQFVLLVICNTDPLYDLKNYAFVPWSEDNEIEALNRIDIGIMPLPQNEWSNGKCGFKALQYMALKKPVVVSPVGVNCDIIEHTKNGFLADSNKDWKTILLMLLQNFEIRKEVGEAGYKTLMDNYSVKSNTNTFLSLFS